MRLMVSAHHYQFGACPLGVRTNWKSFYLPVTLFGVENAPISSRARRWVHQHHGPKNM